MGTLLYRVVIVAVVVVVGLGLLSSDDAAIAAWTLAVARMVTTLRPLMAFGAALMVLVGWAVFMRSRPRSPAEEFGAHLAVMGLTLGAGLVFTPVLGHFLGATIASVAVLR